MPDQSMPPLGPPYGPAGPLPPPIFPEQPPLEWGPRPIEPLPVPPPPPPGRPSRRALAALGGVLVAILVAGALAVWARDDGPTPTARPRRTTTTTTPDSASTDSSTAASSDRSSSSSSSAPTDLNAVIKDIEAFVEQERGLKFKADVPVELATDTAFTDQLFASFDESLPAIQEQEQVLKALGLVPAERDLVADQRALLSAGVLGFYDPKAKRLVVRGSDVTPFVRQILAHELTHALDDQWFDLNRPNLDTADDETSVAFSTLAEGDARTVENAYVDKVLSPSEQLAALDEEQATAAPFTQQMFQLPPVLIALLQFPYDAGTGFVRQLLDHGGNERVDTAFGAPPSTSEQVMEPAKYLRAEPALGITDPAPDGAASPANRGALGTLLLNQLLEAGQSYDATRLDPALEGWGGDRYVTWTDGTRACIKDVIVGDDAAATGRLLQRFQDWAASPGTSARVAPLGPDPGTAFTITSCTL